MNEFNQGNFDQDWLKFFEQDLEFQMYAIDLLLANNLHHKKEDLGQISEEAKESSGGSDNNQQNSVPKSQGNYSLHSIPSDHSNEEEALRMSSGDQPL
jgi:hypothetical protein